MIDLIDREENQDRIEELLADTLGQLKLGSKTSETDRALMAFAAGAMLLTPLQCKLARGAAIDRLGVMKLPGPAGLVDSAFESVRPHDFSTDDSKSGSQILLADVEPSEDPVDGFEMLNALTAMLLRYMAMPFDLALTASLWAIFTHLHDGFWISPILTIDINLRKQLHATGPNWQYQSSVVDRSGPGCLDSSARFYTWNLASVYQAAADADSGMV